MKYFEDMTDIEAIKIRFKELAKTHHPDLGGCVEMMKEINHQYDQVLAGIYQKVGKSISEIEELLADSQEVRNKLCEIIGFPGLVVELCGSWLWITGETRAVKDMLKIAGFSWSPKKLAWYWHKPEETKRRWFRGNQSLDDIRLRHGSTKINDIRGIEKIA